MQPEHLRTFLAIVAEGSLNRAALRRQLSQPTLTRQLQALEQEIGGRLLDRGPTGVQLTDAGHMLAHHAPLLLTAVDRALAETRRLVLGQRDELRIGYLLSAAATFIDPALLALRRQHPEVTARLVELSPGEQIAALRRGELEVALVGQEGGVLGREFYTRSLATYPAVAVLPADHPLAGAARLELTALRDALFVACPDAQMPGRNAWVAAQCRRARFHPRFGPVAESLSHLLSLVVSTPAVCLAPAFIRNPPHPGVRFVDLTDRRATWQLLVVWHRGRASAPLNHFLAALASASKNAPPLPGKPLAP